MDHRLDPVVHGATQCQTGDGNSDLRCGKIKVKSIESLARQLGGPVALLGKLLDLRRAHLHQCELDHDEKAVDQDQTRDEQDLKISHFG